MVAEECMDKGVGRDDRGRKIAVEACENPRAFERGMHRLGGKWTGSILWQLKQESLRFNDLARMVDGASKKTISERLRHLGTDGLSDRQVRATRPLGVVYPITAKGETARRFLDALRRWSEEELGLTANKPAREETT